MIDPRSSVRSVEDLRRAFDESAAPPVATPAPQTGVALEEWLGLRLGGDRFAARLTDIDGLEAEQRVLPLPAAKPELLGLTTVRGRLIPVFDLAALLGRRDVLGDHHWLLLAGAERPVALAFTALETYLRIAPPAPHRSPCPHPYATTAITAEGSEWAVLEVPKIVTAIDPHAGPHGKRLLQRRR